LSFVTGRALLGEKVWRTGPVCVVSYEDDLLEWERRIAAACVHFNIDHDFARENIHFIMRDDDSRVTFAEYSERKVVFPDRDEIIDLIKGQKAVCLMIDPFNLAHDMDDGNNNVMIAKVAREIDYICARTNVAGLALHHLRKGSTGALDDLMGATSLRATFRSVRLLMRMTSKQGEDLKIEDAWRHIQIASTKANFAPPPDKAVWFKLISIDLGNPDELYTDGDQVGVATSWVPSTTFEGMDGSTLKAVFDEMKAHRPSAKSNAKNWAGFILTGTGGRSREQAKKILKRWIDNGVIADEAAWSAARNKVSSLIPVEAKVTEILTSLDIPMSPSEE
jgi:AAA domain